MERFHTHISSLDGSLQKRPEILKPVRVDRTIDIGFRVVNYLVGVFIEIIVGLQRVCIKGRFRLNVFADLSMKMMLAPGAYNGSANLPGFAFQKTEYNRLSHRAASVNLLFSFVLVHKASRTADKSLVGFNRTSHLV